MAGQIKVSILLSVVIAVTVALYFVFVSYFPLAYSAEIADASEISGLDEDLIRAVIWTESKFREDAVSGAGASGLMQLMPATRAEISADSGVAADGSAAVEILLGSLYLREMLLLTGNERDALMAYNAGPTNVTKWKESGQTPFRETADYVGRVSFARRIYKLL